MSEWHVTPDYVINHWTDELLNLMVEKLAERKAREQPDVSSTGQRYTPVEELALRSNNMIKVVQN